MKPSIFRIITTAALALAFSQAALAETRAVTCDGCSEQQMKQFATLFGTGGFVYVFNAADRKVNKYRTETDVLEGPSGLRRLRPFTTFTTAWKVETEPSLKNDWARYVDALDNLGNLGANGTIPLPPDFPVRSVAGVLVDPAFATTAIEDFLLTLPEQHQLAINFNTLISRALDLKLPLVDLRSIIEETTLTFEFPDGSTMDFSIHFSADQNTLVARTELTPAGNARMADGSPAPTSAINFRGRIINDNGGSLIEWIALARSFNIAISGRSTGRDTKMECFVEGTHIRCIVTPR